MLRNIRNNGTCCFFRNRERRKICSKIREKYHFDGGLSDQVERPLKQSQCKHTSIFPFLGRMSPFFFHNIYLRYSFFSFHSLKTPKDSPNCAKTLHEAGLAWHVLHRQQQSTENYSITCPKSWLSFNPVIMGRTRYLGKMNAWKWFKVMIVLLSDLIVQILIV